MVVCQAIRQDVVKNYYGLYI